MSQAKVDYNKEQKKNRKKTLAAERRKRRAGIAAVVVICAAAVGGIGYWGYGKYQAYQEEHITSTPVNFSAVTDYLDNLTTAADAE